MTHPAPRPPLPLRTVVVYSAGAIVALAFGTFMLLASRGSAPVAPEPSPEAVERNLRASEREAREKIKGIWAAYDKAPPDKLRLVLAMTSTKALAESAPARARQEILDDIGVASRYRMAPIVRPENYATDTGGRTLVPSDDAPKCLLWASMWRSEVADELRGVGFTRIECPSRGES